MAGGKLGAGMVVGGMEELLYINTFLAVCLIKIGKVEAILLGNGTFWQMANGPVDIL